MVLELRAPTDVLVEEDFRNAEAELGFPIPDTLRDLLLRANGTQPLPHLISHAGRQCSIAIFLKVDQLALNKASLDRFNPSVLRLLPFAQDDYGNWFCMSTEGAGNGQIFFVDHEVEGDDAIEKMAASLADLFAQAGPAQAADSKHPGVVKGFWVEPGFLESLKKGT